MKTIGKVLLVGLVVGGLLALSSGPALADHHPRFHIGFWRPPVYAPVYCPPPVMAYPGMGYGAGYRDGYVVGYTTGYYDGVASQPVVVSPPVVYQQPVYTPVRVISTPVYVPAPVYMAPAPVYMAPAPVYMAPTPVYAVPAPVYYPAGGLRISVAW